MENTPWRLIPFRQETGAFQMAADECLAVSEGARPTLRLYQWEPYALSLGYHQSHGTINFEQCSQAGIDVVRRPTGGRAVFHADELTYAVILPLHSPLAGGGIPAVHNRISLALAEGIRQSGVDITLRVQSDNLREHYSASAAGELCFSSSTKHELQIGGKKVVGSAQRQFSANILQHGSILLGPAHEDIATLLNLSPAGQATVRAGMKSSTTCLKEHLSAPPDIGDLTASIIRAFQRQFNCECIRQDFSDTELRTIQASVQNYSLSTEYVSYHPS
ncbi:MAG TPA: lipoate--protein ligase family protein [bacterium]|nr:lipoate--protein ligase family protein [bacterium]